MRFTTWLIVLGTMLTGLALAGEQVEVKAPVAPKLTTAERIEQLNQDIFKAERIIALVTDAYLRDVEKKQGAKDAARDRKARDSAIAKLPVLRTERAWLKGETSLAGAEKAVKVAEEAVAKARDGEKAGAQTALDAARAELERVKKLEAAKDF